MNKLPWYLTLVVVILVAGCGAPAPTPTSATPAPAAQIEQPTTAAPPTQPLPAATSAPRPTPPASPIIPDAALASLVVKAQADLARVTNTAAAEVHLKSTQSVDWPDASLGCPKSGQSYAQVVTPGYLIVVEAGGKEYNYHASQTDVVLCEQ